MLRHGKDVIYAKLVNNPFNAFKLTHTHTQHSNLQRKIFFKLTNNVEIVMFFQWIHKTWSIEFLVLQLQANFSHANFWRYLTTHTAKDSHVEMRFCMWYWSLISALNCPCNLYGSIYHRMHKWAPHYLVDSKVYVNIENLFLF